MSLLTHRNRSFVRRHERRSKRASGYTRLAGLLQFDVSHVNFGDLQCGRLCQSREIATARNCQRSS